MMLVPQPSPRPAQDGDDYLLAFANASPAHTSPEESELLSLPSGLSDIAAIEALDPEEVQQAQVK